MKKKNKIKTKTKFFTTITILILMIIIAGRIYWKVSHGLGFKYMHRDTDWKS